MARDAVANWLGFLYPRPPKETPDKRMFTQPIWSLKALLPNPLTDSLDQVKVLELAKQIRAKGIDQPAQLVLDDHWETHYGDLTFDLKKYPDAKKMVSELHALGFTVKLQVRRLIFQIFTNLWIRLGATIRKFRVQIPQIRFPGTVPNEGYLTKTTDL